MILDDIQRIPIITPHHRYDVVLGSNILSNAGQWMHEWLPRQKTAIITDATVARLHLVALEQALDKADIAHTSFILPPTENHKTFIQLESMLQFLLDSGIERSDAIIAFGGGVVGDMTGLAAALLRRGCRFVQIPTTLLAQVDSSVGGKTAVNMPQGKNLVGTFHQPCCVLADTSVLTTLPDRQKRAGYAEIVKYGLIDQPDFFAWLETSGDAVLAGQTDAQKYAIATSIACKARIVAQDETESLGIRELLNLGHTFAHALEADSGFSDKLLHGEAVALGLCLAFQYSTHHGLCPPADTQRVCAHLHAVGLPTRLRDVTQTPGADLVALMQQDKKIRGGRLPFLLVRGIGQAYLCKDVDLRDMTIFMDTVG